MGHELALEMQGSPLGSNIYGQPVLVRSCDFGKSMPVYHLFWERLRKLVCCFQE